MTVTVGREGLAIDGEPFFLLAGCVHYFRWPRAEWRPLLEQARAFGLNTIDTVIPWNLHEPQPGAFDFAGEADLGAYLDLCHELGLKAIVRPGPYICAEWENGGLPAWLTDQPGIRLRTDDERYMGAIERWFDTLLPIIAPRQHPAGPVILCQIENEHWASTVYGHDEHQLSLARAAERRGITVPQYTCMGAMPGRPEFRNGWSGIAEKLVQTRALWPENPMIVSELWSGWFDSWGASRQTRKSPAKLDVTLHQLAAVGCSGFSHWMWAGGTNFGYWGGRTVGGDTIHMTTSYDYDAPVSEFGEAREKAYIARRHHLFLGSALGAPLARVLADARPGGLTVIAPAAVRGRSEGGAQPYRTVRAGPGAPAEWADFCCTFLQNPGLEGAAYQLFLPDGGPHLTVDVEPTSIRPIFAELPLGAELRLAHHTGRILGYWPGADGHDILAVYGPEGERGELLLRYSGDTAWLFREGGRWHDQPPPAVELRGRVQSAPPAAASAAAPRGGVYTELRYWLAADPAVATVHLGERRLHVVLLSTEEAGRFDPADPRWRSGPTPEPAPAPARRAPARVGLPLERLAVAALGDDGAGWAPIDGPQPMERLGCPYGYGWYRAEIELGGPARDPEDDPHPTGLAFPGLSDRAIVFARDGAGQYAPRAVGVGPDGPQYLFSHVLRPGRLELRLLADNLGRFNYGARLGEPKGLLDGIYAGAGQEDIAGGWSALWQEAAFAGEAVAQARPWAVRPDAADVHLGRFAFEGPTVWLLRELYCQPGQRHLLHLTGDRNSGALFVNGVAVERFSRHRSGGVIKADITEQLRPGPRNILALNIQGYAGAPWRATLLRYDPAQLLPARWSFRPGVAPGGPEPRGQWDQWGAPAGPAFYRASFGRERLPVEAAAIRLRLAGLAKGQIWLNGRNVGRFWQIGPQEEYKLPASWLADQNELLIFAEEGHAEAVTLLAG